MKYKDKMTGNILETDNELVEAQFKQYSDRYEPVEEKPVRQKRAADQ